jgi:phosphatidylinositol alpha-1,6-mannosyltransferase
MRVLFISRKHPPSIGGMQRLSYHLIQEMRQRVQATAITWGGSQKLLPLFLLYALARSAWEARRGVDLILAGDPIVAVIGSLLKALVGAPIVTVAHGLDVTFAFRPYQWLIPWVLRQQDRVVCISEAARTACIARGVPAEKCIIIAPGVTVPETLPARKEGRKRLSEMIHRELEGATILVTVGRLVPRKGVAWFLESVYAKVVALKAPIHYVIVGQGPEEDRIRSVVQRLGLNDVVSLTGTVSDDDLGHIYVGADLFVMPNVVVPSDVEGFGLVALEAAAHALPVLAADLAGIRDAVVAGHTGALVEAGDPDAWLEALAKLLGSPDALRTISASARETVSRRFGWGQMADAYDAVFRAVVEERRH